ncbi:MAG TPA: exopolysaccharide biosynthesis polyprenyl glycosylphosphotransferase [Mucilaginibacter sp.]|jgi:putative colanic acid biosynthesis UDP-glucose lipid carrier transferase|nr:exopolysaccharide biosynthesis polyprenyl glycosylphosphotransferase [Mucilaginibacter sp.]
MHHRNTTFINQTVIIIGGGTAGLGLHQYLKNNPERGYTSLGFFDDDAEMKGQPSYLGSIDESINYGVTFGVDEIFCALPASAFGKIEQLMLDADKNLIRFRLVAGLDENELQPAYIEYFGDIPVIALRREPLKKWFNRFVKRVFDVTFSLFIIIFIFSWLFPILAILIKMGSKGSVFFVQQRSGLNNRSFNCYKFRSMYVNTDANKKQASRDDERITGIGAWLRRTSLDELPQFFNVLAGSMSVVGPRPHMITHTRQYAELIDRYMIRHFLKPGITGWAQVNGFRGETRNAEAMLNRVEADVWYLENWSFLLDLKIVFLTTMILFKRDENAF